MKTSVVILNWNTKGYLDKYLPGLIGSIEGMDAEVVVADNASTDGSLRMLIDDYPDLRLLPMDRNYGFTGGYNKVLQLVRSEYFVLINSDVEVDKGWLQPLVDWMDSHPSCGICGPKIHCMDDPGRFEYAGAAGGYLDRYGYPFCRGRVLGRTEKDDGQYDIPRNVMWVTGACLMVRKSVWEQLDGLDDRFFAHMEEIDFCWRAQLAGWEVTEVPLSAVRHLGGGTLPSGSPWKLQLNYRNNLLMLDNNLADTIGTGKASRRIFARKCLDGLAGLAYLLTFRWSSFTAVVKAHNGYRELRKKRTVPRLVGGRVTGYMQDICILPKALLKGGRIFKYLKKYEDSH